MGVAEGGFELTPFQSVLAFVWGDKTAGKRAAAMVDWFADEKTESWPGNPGCFSWLTRDGVVVPAGQEIYTPGRQITCDDGKVILGFEALHRKGSPSLDHYTRCPPVIKGLEFRLDAGSFDPDWPSW